jgi:hypothetical protein
MTLHRPTLLLVSSLLAVSLAGCSGASPQPNDSPTTTTAAIGVTPTTEHDMGNMGSDQTMPSTTEHDMSQMPETSMNR